MKVACAVFAREVEGIEVPAEPTGGFRRRGGVVERAGRRGEVEDVDRRGRDRRACRCRAR